jgi:hypothetical protein
MDEQTKTVVTIESHTRTVIRRSRRSIDIVLEPLPKPLVPDEHEPFKFITATNRLFRRLVGRLKPTPRP